MISIAKYLKKDLLLDISNRSFFFMRKEERQDVA